MMKYLVQPTKIGVTGMNLESHVNSLNAKHAEIEEIIAREEHRPCPDTMRLAQLKKQKLRLKEEMARLRH
ncbi:YdcH family protein [Kordiimonas gwangyangensis]|uniref:YdcH family protein n=2 Tax=Kordiimonas gwangyangensis TaxID=288022 RepID=UPI0034E23711